MTEYRNGGTHRLTIPCTVRTAGRSLVTALDDGISHQLPIALEAFDGSGEVGDEVITQTHRMFQSVGIHGFEIDPMLRALPDQPCLESDPHSRPLGGTKSGSHV